MKYSDRQIKGVLGSVNRNLRKAVIREDGVVLLDEVSLNLGIRPDIAVMTFRGNPVDLSADEANMKRAVDILYRAYRKDVRRKRVREFFQNLSDTLTRNYKIESMTEDEVWAWFALDRMSKNKHKLRVGRIEYMYKINLGNTELLHLPSADGKRKFFVKQNDRCVEINKASNQYLYARAADTFFSIFERIKNIRSL